MHRLRKGATVPATAAPALDVKRISDRYFAAWEARDADAIVALHTEDTVFWSHFGGEPVRGREAVRDTFAGLFETFEGFGFETHRVVLGDDHWVLDWTLTARVDGVPVRFDCMDLVMLSGDGLVARKDTFIDASQIPPDLLAARAEQTS
jgi:ketosteroid isomerase-like protein